MRSGLIGCVSIWAMELHQRLDMCRTLRAAGLVM